MQSIGRSFLANRNLGRGKFLECASIFGISNRLSPSKQSERAMSHKPCSSMVGRHFMDMTDYDANDIRQLLWTAFDLKQRYKEKKEVFQPLAGKTIATIFQKRSTRTRVSVESGIALMGGHSLFLGPDDIHMGVSESIQDTSRVLSSMCDLLFARVYKQSDLEQLAKYSSVPVIHGLSDTVHPLQSLADCLTMYERFGTLSGKTLAWVGDGSNILHSLMLCCPMLGVNLKIASPENYWPHADLVAAAQKKCDVSGSRIEYRGSPQEAVSGADAISTDVWVSMGQEAEAEQRIADFAGFCVNDELVRHAAPDYVFLHCLPRHAEEVTDSVFYDQQHSLVFEQAENRKWTAMAVMLHLLQDYSPQSECRIR